MWIHLLSLELIDGASPVNVPPPVPVGGDATSTPGRRLYSYSYGETDEEKKARRKRWGLLVDDDIAEKVEQAISDKKVGEFVRSLQAAIPKVALAPRKELVRPRYAPDPLPKAAPAPSHYDVIAKIEELLKIVDAEQKAIEVEESDMLFVISVLANA